MADKLPFFSTAGLASVEIKRQYLKVLLSRSVKKRRMLRLKKGMYVTREYVRTMEASGAISSYPAFLSGVLYRPSYLSLEYVLYKHSILTEVPVNFTAVTTKKTSSFSNDFGTFIYRTIRSDLFSGYQTVREGGFIVMMATKAKALFDYCYLRKNHIVDQTAVEELRLNLGEFNRRDKKEFTCYIKKEGSKKMKTIYEHLRFL